MRTEKSSELTSKHMPRFVMVAGKRAVILPEEEYRRLAEEAGWEPPLPAANKDGNYPAAETVAALLAQKIVRRRRALGWTQTDLAKHAGVGLTSLVKLERATGDPSVALVDKIVDALEAAESKRENKEKSARRKTARSR